MKNLYVSPCYVKHDKLKDLMEEFALNGFKNIELSGGTKYYEKYEEDLLELKQKYNFNYLLHNCFPQPKDDFVLNLASPDEEIYEKTIEHHKNAISLSRRLGAKKFSFHAGYFIDLKIGELNRNVSLREPCDSKQAIKRFCEGYKLLKEKAGDIELYIENNVLSANNSRIFKGQNPFMLTDYKSYEELKSFIDFKLLLDVAHLNISANSLNVDFGEELKMLFPLSDYIHVSDNDGLHDQNRCLNGDSTVLNALKDYNFDKKIMALEMRGSISDIKKSQLTIQKALHLNRNKPREKTAL